MTIAKEVVYALHQRLKDLSVNATPDQLAYLAKSLESIAGQSTVLDIVQMTDVKLKELLDSSTSHLNKLDSSKNNALAAISELEGKSLKKIDEKGTTNLSLLDTRKNANIAAINSTGADQLSMLKGLVKNFETVNDVPSGSSIIKEIKKRNMVEPGSLPFLFGVVSRNNDYNWGNGHFTTELGKWYSDTSYTNNMLCLLTGAHSYDTSYLGFYRPPSLYFMQGKNGTFIYRELYSHYQCSSYEYSYPYALLGVIFIKNTTNSEITRTLNFVGTSYWTSQYEGAGAFVGTPNNTNKGQVS